MHCRLHITIILARAGEPGAYQNTFFLGQCLCPYGSECSGFGDLNLFDVWRIRINRSLDNSAAPIIELHNLLIWPKDNGPLAARVVRITKEPLSIWRSERFGCLWHGTARNSNFAFRSDQDQTFLSICRRRHCVRRSEVGLWAFEVVNSVACSGRDTSADICAAGTAKFHSLLPTVLLSTTNIGRNTSPLSRVPSQHLVSKKQSIPSWSVTGAVLTRVGNVWLPLFRSIYSTPQSSIALDLPTSLPCNLLAEVENSFLFYRFAWGGLATGVPWFIIFRNTPQVVIGVRCGWRRNFKETDPIEL